MPKPLVWLGDSLKVVKTFPSTARVQLGDALNALMQGVRPIDTKPLATIASGVAEIRVKDDDSNQYRVIYITKIAQTVHVLHAFQKKSRKTRKTDIDIATDRLKELRGQHGKDRR